MNAFGLVSSYPKWLVWVISKRWRVRTEVKPKWGGWDVKEEEKKLNWIGDNVGHRISATEDLDPTDPIERLIKEGIRNLVSIKRASMTREKETFSPFARLWKVCVKFLTKNKIFKKNCRLGDSTFFADFGSLGH